MGQHLLSGAVKRNEECVDLLLAIAVLPAVYLLYSIYKLDPVEKEPAKLLVRLLVLGALACVPAIALESLGTTYLMGGMPASSIPALLLENFIVIALAEELCKYVMLRLATWKHAAFDYVFDGIVYAVFVSLGFAILENIGYVMQFGMGTGIMRAFTAIPGHAVFGVYMGTFYGLAKRAQGLGNRSWAAGLSICAVVVPMICHGFYDFTASIDSYGALIAFFIFLAIIVVVAKRLAEKMAIKAHRIPGTEAPVAPDNQYPGL